MKWDDLDPVPQHGVRDYVREGRNNAHGLFGLAAGTATLPGSIYESLKNWGRAPGEREVVPGSLTWAAEQANLNPDNPMLTLGSMGGLGPLGARGIVGTGAEKLQGWFAKQRYAELLRDFKMWEDAVGQANVNKEIVDLPTIAQKSQLSERKQAMWEGLEDAMSFGRGYSDEVDSQGAGLMDYLFSFGNWANNTVQRHNGEREPISRKDSKR